MKILWFLLRLFKAAGIIAFSYTGFAVVVYVSGWCVEHLNCTEFVGKIIGVAVVLAMLVGVSSMDEFMPEE